MSIYIHTHTHTHQLYTAAVPSGAGWPDQAEEPAPAKSDDAEAGKEAMGTKFAGLGFKVLGLDGLGLLPHYLREH